MGSVLLTFIQLLAHMKCVRCWSISLSICRRFSHFQLLQNHCMLKHQTYHNCSSMNPEKVLHLFEAIRNPRWLSWLLIGRGIFDFLYRTAACEVMFLWRSLIQKKCCFSEWFKIQLSLHHWMSEQFMTLFSRTTSLKSPECSSTGSES